jgi:O-methyltransferase
MLKKYLKSLFATLGYEIIKDKTYYYDFFPDTSDDHKTIINAVRPYTMTSLRRLEGLLKSVEYLHANNIEGDVVECGVWKGGSIIAAANALFNLGDLTRSFYLFDTFSGMTEPGANDPDFVKEEYQLRKGSGDKAGWYSVSKEDVLSNILRSCEMPSDCFHLIEGDVNLTLDLHENLPNKIALLRLDTDWYESTKKEMEVLLPRVSSNGVVIIDDYGCLEGARKAVDEYLFNNQLYPLIHSLDSTCRIFIKNWS